MSPCYTLMVTICAAFLMNICFGQGSEEQQILIGPYGQCSKGDVKCDNYGVCKKDRIGYYVCACPEGFSGKYCQIVGQARKCELKCDNGGVCQINDKGNQSCACPDGFSGTLCENEVDLSEMCNYFKCFNGGECLIVDEVPICDCPRGYRGYTCDEIDQCASYVCYNGGRCKQVNGEVSCLCGKRFKGKRCELI